HTLWCTSSVRCNLRRIRCPSVDDDDDKTIPHNRTIFHAFHERSCSRHTLPADSYQTRLGPDCVPFCCTRLYEHRRSSACRRDNRGDCHAPRPFRPLVAFKEQDGPHGQEDTRSQQWIGFFQCLARSETKNQEGASVGDCCILEHCWSCNRRNTTCGYAAVPEL